MKLTRWGASPLEKTPAFLASIRLDRSLPVQNTLAYYVQERRKCFLALISGLYVISLLQHEFMNVSQARVFFPSLAQCLQVRTEA